jgi:hypothetical protein
MVGTSLVNWWSPVTTVPRRGSLVLSKYRSGRPSYMPGTAERSKPAPMDLFTPCPNVRSAGGLVIPRPSRSPSSSIAVEGGGATPMGTRESWPCRASARARRMVASDSRARSKAEAAARTGPP